MNVINQKPVELTPVYHDSITKDFDVNAIIDELVIDPLFTPAVTGSDVHIQLTGSKDASKDEVRDLLMKCCQVGIDPASEALMKKLLGQCLVSYNAQNNLSVVDMYTVQSATKEGLPEPTPTCVYTPAVDVIPSAKKFLAGTGTYDAFFASLAYYARPETLGFWFTNEVAFADFVTYFQNQTNQMSSVLPQDTNRMIADFCQLNLQDLTESLLLRKDDGDSVEPVSFARLLVEELMEYVKGPGTNTAGVLPFNFGELVCPKSVVFVNVEKHSHATPHQIADEWKLINNCLQAGNKPRMVSNKKLTKLTAQQRNLQKITAQAVTAANNQNVPTRASTFRFRKTKMSHVDVAKAIKKVLDKMAFVNTSMNTFKKVKSTFAKPNRRDPDDFNKRGKSVSTKYKPDIHLYIDTSGSISERDYEDAVKACIELAKKCNINMYFNSFADTMTQTTKLHLVNKSSAQVYKEFQHVPKVTGGTDYEQIWNFINSSKKRTRELSIIITDFEYYARSAYVRHPKNLYYLPCSTVNWDWIVNSANGFCQSMVHNDPAIRTHLLF